MMKEPESMSANTDQLMEQIGKWVVNDYFTPNIKAEVVLDTLLTPYVSGIIKAQCGDKVKEPVFVTKEMSIFEAANQSENTKYGNKGAKIDYILAEPDDSEEMPVYLAELKTTDSGLEKDQVKRYIQNCRDKSFGAVFGDKLLRIVSSAFGKTYRKEFLKNFGEGPWGDQTLPEAFNLVFDMDHIKKLNCRTVAGSGYADKALSLIKKAGWTQSDSARSRKYLYTMG